MTFNENDDIHRKLDFIARAYTTLHNEIIRRRLPEDDFALNQISKLLHEISKISIQFSKETKERETFRMPEEFVELIGTMRFISKKMDGIEKRFKELESLDFKHQVKITVDSSSLDKFNCRKINDDPYENLLSSIHPQFAEILILKFGLYSRPKSYALLSKIMGRSPSTLSHMVFRALKKCSDLDKRDLVNALPEGELKKQILKNDN